jgi:hypothetical protein
MMKTRVSCFYCKVMILLWMLSCHSYAEASGSGFTMFVSPFPFSEVEKTYRQHIDLDAIGSELIGRPSKGSIRLIMMEAVGSRTAGLMLRETAMSDGSKMLFLTAPDSVMEKVKRMTLYVDRTPKNEILAEWKSGKWILQRLKVDAAFDGPILDGNANELYAFSVTTFGPFRLFPRDSQDSLLATNLQKYPDPTLVGKNALLGLWKIIPPILFMGLMLVVSKYIHSRRKRFEDKK